MFEQILCKLFEAKQQHSQKSTRINSEQILELFVKQNVNRVGLHYIREKLGWRRHFRLNFFKHNSLREMPNVTLTKNNLNSIKFLYEIKKMMILDETIVYFVSTP